MMLHLSPALRAALCGGLVIAAMYLAVFAGSSEGMVLVYLVPSPLFAVGLAYGLTAALVATALAVVVMMIVTGGLALPLTFLVTTALPVLPLVRQALLSRHHPDGAIEWYPPGLLLMVLTGVGGTLILLAYIAGLIFGDAGGLKTFIHDALSEILGQLLRDIGGGAGTSVDDSLMGLFVQIFPGAAVTSLLALVMVNGLLVQAVLVRLHWLQRPPLRMSDVELPHWSPPLLALTLAGASISSGDAGFVLVNLAIVLALPFLFAGLAVVHAFAASRPSKVMVLVVFYVLVAFFAWLVLAVIGLGIIEQWAGLRRRFGAGLSDRGDV
jgi:hypothetical protein